MGRGGSSVSDSNDSTVRVKGKKDKGGLGGFYFYLKILNNLLYIATLFLAINYYMKSKYTTKFVSNAFFLILVARPALILLYSISAILIEMVRRQSKSAKPWKKKSKGGESGPSDISESQEASEGDES